MSVVMSGKKAVFKTQAFMSLCTGCMACVDACNKGALSQKMFEDGHIYPYFSQDTCIDCGLCDSVCPVADNKETILSYGDSRPYAAWSDNDRLREGSASGGVFAALAKHVLNEGWYVSGAVTDGLKIRHVVTDKTEDLSLIQGSKYQQGETAGIYRKIRKLLTAGKNVLFSGTPCQVAALRMFLGDRNYPGKVVTVDFICGGFPSVLPLQAFVSNCSFDVKSIVSFRDKENGWKPVGYRYNFKVGDAEGRVHSFHDNNLVSMAFISHLTNRDSCLNCRFARADRPSDITIGDFWGCKDYPEQESSGISVVIVHNDEILGLLRDSGVHLKETGWKSVVNYNPRLIVGEFFGFRRTWIHSHYPFVFRHFGYSLLCSMFGAKGGNRLLQLLGRCNLYRLKVKYRHKKRAVIERFLNELKR